MTSSGFAQLLSTVFAGRTVGGVVQGVAATLPTVFKYVLGLLLLVNIRSLPLVWHCAYAEPLFALLR